MKTYILIKTQIEGFHKWSNAPKKVNFLQKLHRHLFYIKSKIEVYHDDRELEFILVKRFINNQLPRVFKKLGNTKSCEQIAKALLKVLLKKYGNRDIIVHVLEDNENGAIVEYKKEEE